VRTRKALTAILCGAVAAWLIAVSAAVLGAQVKNAAAAKIKNPVKATPESIEAGKTAYNKYCKFCHNEGGTGDGPLAPKDSHPPSLIDAKWDHGSTDGEIFTNIKDGIPDSKMKAMKEKMKDEDIWNVVNYLHSLGPKK
jgi:mono/diheme cytochrome c family protein